MLIIDRFTIADDNEDIAHTLFFNSFRVDDRARVSASPPKSPRLPSKLKSKWCNVPLSMAPQNPLETIYSNSNPINFHDRMFSIPFTNGIPILGDTFPQAKFSNNWLTMTFLFTIVAMKLLHDLSPCPCSIYVSYLLILAQYYSSLGLNYTLGYLFWIHIP